MTNLLCFLLQDHALGDLWHLDVHPSNAHLQCYCEDAIYHSRPTDVPPAAPSCQSGKEADQRREEEAEMKKK